MLPRQLGLELAPANVSAAEDLVDHRAEQLADLLPGVALTGDLERPPAALATEVCVVDGLGHRRRHRVAVVRRDQPARLAVVDDRRRSSPIDGDHRQSAGHRLDQHLAELLADRGVDEDVGGREEAWELVVAVPAGEEDVAYAETLDRLDRVLALPLAGVAAEENQGGGRREGIACLSEGLDQQSQPLHLGEAAAVEQRRPVQDREVLLGVADAPGFGVRTPAARRLDQVASPVGAAIDVEWLERRVEAVGDEDEAGRIEIEQIGRANPALGAVDDDPLAPGSPPEDALRPLVGLLPMGGGSATDPLQHQQLGAVDVADHRDVRETAKRRLVDRRQVMQVEEVVRARSGVGQLAAPGLDVDLEGLIVEGREDGVGSIRPVLVGAVHRRFLVVVELGRHPEALQGRHEVDDGQVATRKEVVGESVVAEVGA